MDWKEDLRYLLATYEGWGGFTTLAADLDVSHTALKSWREALDGEGGREPSFGHRCDICDLAKEKRALVTGQATS